MVSVSTTISAQTRTLVWAGRLCVGLPAAVGHARINLRDRGSRSLNPPCSHATLKTKSAFCGQATRAQMTGSCTLVPKTEADKKEAQKSICSVLNAFESPVSLIVHEGERGWCGWHDRQGGCWLLPPSSTRINSSISPSVRPSVRLSVRPSVHSSVHACSCRLGIQRKMAQAQQIRSTIL